MRRTFTVFVTAQRTAHEHIDANILAKLHGLCIKVHAREGYSVSRCVTDSDECLFDLMYIEVLLMKFLKFFFISFLRNYK